MKELKKTVYDKHQASPMNAPFLMSSYEGLCELGIEFAVVGTIAFMVTVAVSADLSIPAGLACGGTIIVGFAAEKLSHTFFTAPEEKDNSSTPQNISPSL
jgi:hypothetical protein